MKKLVKAAFQLFSLVKYWILAKNEHSIHAPFLFGLYTTVISAKSPPTEFGEIEKLRMKMLADQSTISFQDIGASQSLVQTSAATIAKGSISTRKKSSLQVRLLRHFRPSVIIEIGTSLGINACYLQKACPEAKVLTFEGITEIASLARKNFLALEMSHIELIEGQFEDTLERTLAHNQHKIDYAFIDGNHTYEATIRYFQILRAHSHDQTVFVIDDIHWSSEMQRAWTTIQSLNEVKITVDLYQVGLVFFNKTLSKQNFVLRF